MPALQPRPRKNVRTTFPTTAAGSKTLPPGERQKAVASHPPMKIATYNVNGIKSRLPNLLEWLAREQPDVACLQELKALDGAFPAVEIREAGYSALWKGQRSWNGVAILARDREPVEIRRDLPGDPLDEHSRYLEAAVNGIVVICLYLPNGNPQPGPKFDYKLAWFARLIEHAASLVTSDHPVVMAGDYNVVPTDFDIYNPRSWLKDALLQPESRECYQKLLAQGWTDSIRNLHQDEAVFTSGTTSANTGNVTPACVSTTFCSTRR